MSGESDGPRRLNYAYYTGCVPKQSGRELDVATRLVCERLGIGLREMTGAPCCGAGDVDESRPALNRAVNAVTLAQAERAGLDILTICNVCTLNLRAVNAALRGDGDPRWTEVWSHIHLGYIFDVTGQRDRAVNEYRLAVQTNVNTQGAINEARARMQTPYKRERADN